MISLHDEKCSKCSKVNKYFEPRDITIPLKEDEWRCEGCMMKNIMPNYKCRGCKLKNSQVKLILDLNSAKAETKVKHFWQCTFCKASNDSSRKVCSACFSSKPLHLQSQD